MKNIVILGAGTAGTMMAHNLSRAFGKDSEITIIDQHKTHYYQPGFLFIPFGTYTEKDVVRQKNSLLPSNVRFIQEAAEVIDKEKNSVVLKNGTAFPYDVLVIATGCRVVPDEIEGLKSNNWYKNAFDFYTLPGALALHDALRDWKGGRLVIHLAEMPIKCPVAPLEFTFLADSFLREKGIRDKVDITYVTPLSGAFTKQNCSNVLGYLLNEKNITLVPEFAIDRVDPDERKLISFDEKTVEYDLLVTVPTNKGDDVIERSGIGDELNFVPTDKNTLQSNVKDNIFVIGDATDVPASKAGSVAHFESEVLTKNIKNYFAGNELEPGFDGHANCFIESGSGKAFLIDFNYDIEPVEGEFPLPFIGPFKLLKETRINHTGKLAFKWIYWNILLRGLPMPGITTKMTKVGKKLT